MIVRIYTEQKPTLAELVSKYFVDFAVIPASAYIQGEREDCAIIELVGDDTKPQVVVELCQALLSEYGLDQVGLSYLPSHDGT